ncbi:MAG: hypothetical protein SOV22_03025 [Blautia obeum]|nr:hypothetical protein [Blautia obeum]
MDNITSRQGVAHFSSRNMRSIIESIVGRDYYIANIDECLSLELSTNNKIKIRSGVLIHHGNVSQVKKGTYDEVSYLNGSQGMKRIDLIVSRLTKDASTEIEKQEWICIQGTPSESDPQAPSYTEGNIQEGDLVDDCPFAELHFDGINVTEVKQLVPVARNTEELEAELDELNRNIKIVESGSNSNGNYRKYSDGTIEMWGEAAFANIAINNKDNWNYYSNQLTVNLPCASVSIPKITGTVRNDSGAWLSIPGRGLGYDLFRAWVYASSPITSQNVWIAWHAFGTWK